MRLDALLTQTRTQTQTQAQAQAQAQTQTQTDGVSRYDTRLGALLRGQETGARDAGPGLLRGQEEMRHGRRLRPVHAGPYPASAATRLGPLATASRA